MKSMFPSNSWTASRMIFLTVLTSLAFLLFAGCKARSAPQSPSENTDIKSHRSTLHSSILKEDRPYRVYLPESYTNKVYLPKSYPVLYLLDGDYNFYWASAVVQFLAQNRAIPELIIVAIPNTDRTRDLTPTHSTRSYFGTNTQEFASSGGGEQFLKFFREELIPHIETEYRTAPYRILVGHSFGGLFALDALLQEPQTFQGIIAIDPSLWWDDRVLLHRAEAFAKTNDFTGAVYISIANMRPHVDVDDKLQWNARRDFATLLQAHNSATFRSTSQAFDNEMHRSVPMLSLYHGLEFLFDGYQMPYDVAEKPALIPGHFADVSRRLGVQLLPDEMLVDQSGAAALYGNHDPDKAIQWFKINTTNYPRSCNAWSRLGTAYDLKGDKQLSRASFEKVLALKEEGRHAAERLR